MGVAVREDLKDRVIIRSAIAVKPRDTRTDVENPGLPETIGLLDPDGAELVAPWYERRPWEFTVQWDIPRVHLGHPSKARARKGPDGDFLRNEDGEIIQWCDQCGAEIYETVVSWGILNVVWFDTEGQIVKKFPINPAKRVIYVAEGDILRVNYKPHI
jgi:hypothetical protein